MGSGDPTFPPWRRYGPSSIGPHSPRQRALFNSSNSFLMFQEAPHQKYGLGGSLGLRHKEDSLWERRGVIGKGLHGKVWRTWAELRVTPALCPSSKKGRGSPWAPYNACRFSEQQRAESWQIPQPSWMLRAMPTEHLVCANRCEQKRQKSSQLLNKVR